MPKVSKVKQYQQQRLEEIKIAVAQRKRQELQQLDGNIENQVLTLTSENGQLGTCAVTQTTFNEVPEGVCLWRTRISWQTQLMGLIQAIVRNPCQPRNMPIRNPAYIEEAIKKKEAKKPKYD